MPPPTQPAPPAAALTAAAPPADASGARAEARLLLAALDGREVRFYGALGGALVGLSRVELPAPVAAGQHGWRGGELVVMDRDGLVLGIRDETVRVVERPPREAWTVPLVEVEAKVALAVVGTEIWKGRCVSAVGPAPPRCNEYAWLRLEPPSSATRARLPAPPEPPVEPPPSPGEDYRLQAATFFLEPDAPEREAVACTHGALTTHFPDSDPEVRARYGRLVFDAGKPRWLGAARPLWVALAAVEVRDSSEVMPYLFEGCVEEPLFGSPVSLREGPRRWIAAAPLTDVRTWSLFRDGVPAGSVEASEVTFAPIEGAAPGPAPSMARTSGGACGPAPSSDGDHEEAGADAVDAPVCGSE